MPADTVCRAALSVCLSFAIAVAVAACASTGRAPSPADLAARIGTHGGPAIRTAPGAPELPVGTAVGEGISREDAVAIALWNNPDFQIVLADLGVARAEVAQAGLLRNPVFTLLPWGPKQLEATLKMADRGVVEAASSRRGPRSRG